MEGGFFISSTPRVQTAPNFCEPLHVLNEGTKLADGFGIDSICSPLRCHDGASFAVTRVIERFRRSIF